MEKMKPDSAEAGVGWFEVMTVVATLLFLETIACPREAWSRTENDVF
jgi:hypothetical protein